MSLPLALVSILALAPAPAQADEPETYASSERGFALELPDDGWRFVESGGDTDFKLNVVCEGTGGTVGASVEVKPTTVSAASELVEKALVFVDGREGYSDAESFEGEVAGLVAPGVRVNLEQAGTVYALEARFVVDSGQQYELECWAPAADFEERIATFRSMFETFRLVELDDDARDARRLRSLAARCGSEVDWADDWKAAAKRAKRERKPVLVFVWSYPSFDISNSGLSETFMEPEILRVVAESYVPVRWTVGRPAPFVDEDVYGLSGSTFGRALLVVSAGGEILHQTPTLHPAHAIVFLEESLAGLPEPKKPGGGADVPLGLVEVRASIHAGENRDARVALDTILARGEDDPARAEALFWSGALDSVQKGANAARETWMRLIDAHEDDRWAWKAAAALQSTTVALGYPYFCQWPDETSLRPLRRVPYEPAKTKELEEVRATALAWLLAEQRENGSWPGTRDFPSPLDHPNPFTDATAAIAGLALLRHPDDGDAKYAARRALDYVLATNDRVRAEEPPIHYMDYTVWSRAWMLWFLAECFEGELGDAERIRDTSSWLVESLASKQRRNGGWSYYHTSDSSDASGAGEQSISFTTAAVTHALLRAEQAGLAVPATVRDEALDVLEAMRNGNGTFEYMLYVGGSAQGGGNVPGAAGRSPVCELALMSGGRSDAKRVEQAVEQFLDHADELSRELGKALMHAGKGGQGCHYLLFDYAFAAEATNELPARARKRARTRVLELILEARSEEGAFQDTPINGWSYGTAMALFALGGSAAE